MGVDSILGYNLSVQTKNFTKRDLERNRFYVVGIEYFGTNNG